MRDRLRRKLLATSFVVACAMVVGATGVLAQTDRFRDDDGNVHEASIEAIAAAGITRGCNPPVNDRYCPSFPVSRGEMAAFLHRALELDPSGPGDRFVDDDSSVFQNEIEAIAVAGITRGCNPPINSRFCPDAPVTRAQMAAFLARALPLPAAPAGDRFVDDSGPFENDIERIAAAGITLGCNPPANNRYCPDGLVLRDQMASFLARALGLLSAAPGTTTTSVGIIDPTIEVPPPPG